MTTADQVILERYHEKCRIAGGHRAGYVLRREAILRVAESHPEADLEGGLASLVDAELLQANEAGSFFFLTAAGVEKLAELFGE